MREGAIVEQGPGARILRAPAEDYTRRLLDASPRLAASQSREA
jgi:ABC-type dipeptide/oligopeptide/nickel transport system ATPase component